MSQLISLVGAADYLPENIITNDFFHCDSSEADHPMFKGTVERRHVNNEHTVTDMVINACEKLKDRYNLNFSRDVDILLLNTTILDMPFTGCAAEIAHKLGAKPEWIIDVHNGGCVSFIYMMDIARSLMAGSDAKTALICNVQNAAGRVFNHPENRERPQSAIPGDGCGVGYLVANDSCPVKSIVKRSHGQYVKDMKAVSPEGAYWWEPRKKAMHIGFTESKLAAIVGRGNRLVPEALYEAMEAAKVTYKDVDKLITNQPNQTFLRNWRESICLSEENHLHTFPSHGNLFGAALPISLAQSIEQGRIKSQETLLMGGFAHAGDYSAGAVINWK